MSYHDAPAHLDQLLAAERNGVPLDMLFFWGHRPGRNGSPGPGCLSQWWPAPFTVAGRTFATAEHYMMWAKAVTFDNEAVARDVLATVDPRDAKRLGRSVAWFDEAVWAEHSWDAVLEGNRAKFGQHPNLRQFLLDTGDRVLVETSPVDSVWGIGLSADNPDAMRPSRWKGTNRLGFALMKVRSELR